MKFYDREKEIRFLKNFLMDAKKSRILVITGRRRIGKTRLVLETFGKNALYFFTKKKGIKELLSEWENELKKRYEIYGKFENFEDFLKFLFSKSKNRPLVIIFDEVQNLYYSYPEAFSSFQKVFDLNKENSKLLLVFTGSTFSLIEKIFKNSKEPLFGRASEILNLSYLPVKTLEDILKDHGIFTGENLLHLYSIFDGIPYYIEEFIDIKGRTFKKKLETMLKERELLWEEGENLLRIEIGKDYSSYFSILTAISKGKRTRNEIIQYTGISEVGGYLSLLENNYRIIERKVPVLKKKNSKLSRYYISDNFTDFWFNFLDKYRNYKELGNIDYALKKIWEELPSYEGRKLEKLVLKKIVEERIIDDNFSLAGGYWDRKGKIEIDLILINEEDKRAYLFEIKRSKRKITRDRLKFLKNASAFIGELKNFSIKVGVSWVEKEGVRIEILENI